MHPGTRWSEKFSLLGLVRVGTKMREAFFSALTGSKLNGRLNGAESCSPIALYSEEAFQSLLASESKRSERTGHHCQILLVYRIDTQGAIVPMEPDFAKIVTTTLFRNLRDTDYVGWYREGRVLGGVLTLLSRDFQTDACTRIRTSLVDTLRSELRLNHHHSVQVRVCQPYEVKAVELG